MRSLERERTRMLLKLSVLGESVVRLKDKRWSPASQITIEKVVSRVSSSSKVPESSSAPSARRDSVKRGALQLKDSSISMSKDPWCSSAWRSWSPTESQPPGAEWKTP